MLNNKVYDVLKWITLVFLPALTTLTGVILNCFNIDCTDIVLTIMTAVTTFMGAILGISNILFLVFLQCFLKKKAYFLSFFVIFHL